VVLNLEELNLGNGPRLVVSIVAVPEGDWLIVDISVSNDIKAFSFLVSDVSLTARVEVESLLLLSSPLSDDCSSADGKTGSSLVGNDEVSVGSSSHGSGSLVEDEPCSLVVSISVLDSESVLTSSHVLIPEELSVSRHLGFEQELNLVAAYWLDSCFLNFSDSSDSFLLQIRM